MFLWFETVDPPPNPLPCIPSFTLLSYFMLATPSLRPRTGHWRVASVPPPAFETTAWSLTVITYTQRQTFGRRASSWRKKSKGALKGEEPGREVLLKSQTCSGPGDAAGDKIFMLAGRKKLNEFTVDRTGKINSRKTGMSETCENDCEKSERESNCSQPKTLL